MTQPPHRPEGYLHVFLQGNPMTSNMITPRVRLNGHWMPTHYGENVYPVPPGAWHVDVDAQWMRTFGQAAIDVQVAQGERVRVFYAAPMHQFTTGSIGFVPQRRKGVLTFWLVLGIALTIAVLVVVLCALGGLLD